MPSKTKTLVRTALLILAGLDEVLSIFPTNFWELNNWSYVKERRRAAWARLIDKFSQPQARAQVKYLTKRGYLKQQGTKFSLSERGWQKIALDIAESFGKQQGQGPLKYIIVFDIPEDAHRVRDLLRKCVITVGFRFLQQSVFITNSEKALQFIEQLVNNCGLKQYVRFIKAEKIW